VRLVYLHEFVAEFLDLDRSVQAALRRKLDEMARAEFKSFPHQPLKGSQFKGLHKLRAGDWRLIYQIRGEEIWFITLGHRSEIYR
jgi:addiction module RelE/StbE family toxin